MKKLLSIILVAMLSLSLFGCTASQQPAATSEQPAATSEQVTETSNEPEATAAAVAEPLKIGVAFAGWNTNQNWLQFGKLLHETYDPLGYTFYEVDLASAEDVPVAVENFISAECDIVLLHGHYKEAVTAVLPDLKAAGIAVGTVDNDFQGIEGMTYGIRCDDYTTGYFLGEEVAKWCNETLKDKAIVGILGYEAAEAFGSRAWAIKDAMEKNMTNGEVVIVGDASSSDSWMSAAENMLSAYPDMNVMVTIAGAFSVACYEASKAAGWDERPQDSCGVFGMDATDDELNIILQDKCFKASLDLDLQHQYMVMLDKLITYKEDGNQYPDGTTEDNIQGVYPMTLVFKDRAADFLGSK